MVLGQRYLLKGYHVLCGFEEEAADSFFHTVQQRLSMAMTLYGVSWVCFMSYCGGNNCPPPPSISRQYLPSTLIKVGVLM